MGRLDLNTTPGGHDYPAGSSTFDGVFPEGFQKMMESADRVNESVKVEAAALTGYVETDPSTGYAFAVQDAEGRVGELALDPSGEVPQWVLDRWALRLGGSASSLGAFQREALVSAFKQRRGQRIGTGGKAVVCLRFDHGWGNFTSTVLPLLRERALPCTQMVNPSSMGDAANGGVTYSTIQSLWLNDGVEVANHGQSHGIATTPAEIENHIVGALQDIQDNLPASKVEAYIPGGVTGTGADDFAGRTIEEFYKTYAGPLAMQHHAAVFGYTPGIYRELPQDMNLGGAHISGDTWALTDLKFAVDETSREGAATTFMFHPELIGSTGNISVADFTALLDYIKAQRDSGIIEVLTMTGSLIADPGTSARHDLIRNGSFRDGLTGWSNTTGWTTGTGSVSHLTTTTGVLLRQFESGRHALQVEGSNREMHARFRAPTGATVRVSVSSGSNGLAATREVTLPASSNWVTVRQPFSIPVSPGALTFDVGRVSGGQVDIADVRAQTI